MILFFISIFFLNSLVIPPGTILDIYKKELSKINSLKLEYSVVYGKDEIQETFWFKSGSFRSYVRKNEDAILFIREGDNCIAITAGMTIASSDLCKKTPFYYDFFLPSSGFYSFIKSLNLKTNTESRKINNIEGVYSKTEDVILARYNGEPIYMLGITEDSYKSFFNKEENVDLALEKIKDKYPQIWFSKKNMLPLYLYGKIKNLGYVSVFIKNYEEIKQQWSSFFIPKVIKITDKDINIASFGLNSYEFNLDISDSLFDVKDYKEKFLAKTIKEEDLSDNKKILMNYLKDFR